MRVKDNNQRKEESDRNEKTKGMKLERKEKEKPGCAWPGLLNLHLPSCLLGSSFNHLSPLIFSSISLFLCFFHAISFYF